MDKNEIYAKVNAKQQEIVDVWDQINLADCKI